MYGVGRKAGRRKPHQGGRVQEVSKPNTRLPTFSCR